MLPSLLTAWSTVCGDRERWKTSIMGSSCVKCGHWGGAFAGDIEISITHMLFHLQPPHSSFTYHRNPNTILCLDPGSRITGPNHCGRNTLKQWVCKVIVSFWVDYLRFLFSVRERQWAPSWDSHARAVWSAHDWRPPFLSSSSFLVDRADNNSFF